MKFSLYLTVMVSGAVVMILEIVGSRLVAPYIGTSVIVWTSLIGVVLGSLSVGYYLGGIWADKGASLRNLSRLALLSGVLIGVIPILLRVAPGISALGSIYLSSVLLALILFTPATVVLGMITSYATRLSLSQLNTAGITVGRIYALSTVGSILGTFLSGFILIPLIGSSRIIFWLSATMIAIFLILLVSKDKKSKEVLMGFVAVPLLFLNSPPLPFPNVLIDTDTPYSRTWIYDTKVDGGTVRSLTNSIYGIQSMMLLENESLLIAGYLRTFRELTLIYAQTQSPSLALAIGGSTYTFPRVIIKDFPELELDVVEIDPGVTQLAKDYFNFRASARLNVIQEDGRIFLNRAQKQYDIVYVDAFQSDISIPFQLVTKEAVERLREITSPQGIVLTNFIAKPGSEIMTSLYSTYKSVFPYTYIIQVDSVSGRLPQNYILVATKSRTFAEAIEKEAQLVKVENLEEGRVFTDDYAPIEKYTSKLLR